MTAKHTPGPWKYDGITEWVDGHGWYVDLPTPLPRRICVSGASAEEADANARLIAAAPEMLAALRSLCAALVHDRNRHIDYWQEALAAIAKAEGRE